MYITWVEISLPVRRRTGFTQRDPKGLIGDPSNLFSNSKDVKDKRGAEINVDP